jgi:WhiB family redox-sensing transcriptional regulator
VKPKGRVGRRGAMTRTPNLPRPSPVNERASQPDRWMDRASCRDATPAIMFPTDGAGVEIARCFCAECPVRTCCLEYALTNHIEYGVWGGTSETERQRMIPRQHRPSR